MAQTSDIIVGLDLGTSKICAMVGRLSAVAQAGIDIVGVGTEPCRGLRRGVVVNVEATVVAIGAAVRAAEAMSGCRVHEVYVGIAGAHIEAFSSRGQVKLARGVIRQKEIDQVVDAAQNVLIAQNRRVLHVLPRTFYVDHHDEVQVPLGIHGDHLAADVHIVTASATSAQNILTCAARAGLQVAELVLEPLASSHAALWPDEKELGIALIDMGGGTTDLAVWRHGSLVHTSVLPLGGDHITQDIAIGLRTPWAEAERIKRQHGRADAAPRHPAHPFDVVAVGGRSPTQADTNVLAEIVGPRVQEIWGLMQQHISQAGVAEAPGAGVVLTGGTSLLPGMARVAQDVLQLPVRCGGPHGFLGLGPEIVSPTYATSAGLLAYGRHCRLRRAQVVAGQNIPKKLYGQICHLLGEIF